MMTTNTTTNNNIFLCHLSACTRMSVKYGNETQSGIWGPSGVL